MADGLDLAMTESWDIMVLDRMLPGRIDGWSIIEKLRSLGNSTPAIIVSALSSIDERVLGLRGGADDYLPKPFACSELLARIKALRRRASAGQDSSNLQVADLKLDTRAMRVTRAERLIALQRRMAGNLDFWPGPDATADIATDTRALTLAPAPDAPVISSPAPASHSPVTLTSKKRSI